MHFTVRLLALSLSAIVGTFATASECPHLFGDHSILQSSLRAPLTTMFSAKDDVKTYIVNSETLEKDTPWFKYGVEFSVDGAESVRAKVRVRGGVRRNSSFPPIKLKIKKKDAQGTRFEGFHAFKLVTHSEGDYSGRAMPSREHALYQVYAVLSPVHFRSRLLNLRYIDRLGGIDSVEPALLLENAEDVAANVAMTEVKLTWLENARFPRNDEYEDELEFAARNLEFAMFQTLRLEARAAGLPDITDFEQSGYKLREEILNRREIILARQREIKNQIDPLAMARNLIFQILINNSDWNIFDGPLAVNEGYLSFENLKNAKLLSDRSGKLFPVPYDFDLAQVFEPWRGGDSYHTRLRVVLENLNDHSQPPYGIFVEALREFVSKENDLLVVVARAHLIKADKENLIHAIRDFGEAAKSICVRVSP
jgi:hypothetical protein